MSTPTTVALGADGKPVPKDVPADFDKEQADAKAAQLTPEEVAEFRALRQAKKDEDERVAREAAEAALLLQPDTHHVHLADGSVVDGSSIATHYDLGDGPLPVAGSFLKREFVNLFG
jgi:hypothetical protein